MRTLPKIELDQDEVDKAARALVKEFRKLWPRGGFPALVEARLLVRAAIAALPGQSGEEG